MASELDGKWMYYQAWNESIRCEMNGRIPPLIFTSLGLSGVKCLLSLTITLVNLEAMRCAAGDFCGSGNPYS